MRAFVTGGTGFVGSHVVDALLSAGHEVTCLVRDPQKARRIFPRADFTVVRGDLADASALTEGSTGADVVFHVAALTAARTRREFFEVNEGATKRLLQAVERAAPELKRFVYVSSLAAAGPSRRGRAHQGGEPENPVTHYGASKLAAELAVRASALPWTIVRASAVYGPRDTELFRVFRLARQGLAPVFGDGSQELSFVYAVDLARALVAVAGIPDTAGKTYYASHPDIVRARAFVTAVHRIVRARTDATPLIVPIPGPAARVGLWITGTAARLAGKATLLSPDKANEFLAEAWTCSPAAMERDTGWTASFSLSTGLSATAEWYRTHGWL